MPVKKSCFVSKNHAAQISVLEAAQNFVKERAVPRRQSCQHFFKIVRSAQVFELTVEKLSDFNVSLFALAVEFICQIFTIFCLAAFRKFAIAVEFVCQIFTIFCLEALRKFAIAFEFVCRVFTLFYPSFVLVNRQASSIFGPSETPGRGCSGR